MEEHVENKSQIAMRVRCMRELLELSAEEVSKRLDITPEQYLKYENEEAVLPVSTLYALAGIFGVDFTTLLTGEAPRMGGYAIVRQGQGIDVSRNPEYHFQSLAYNFKGRTMEPMIVTLDPKEKPAGLVTHNGQEFNLVLEGSLKLLIGKHEFILNAGDSIYFDPTLPHAQHALDKPARFLTVIQ